MVEESKDATERIVREYAARDSRFSVFTQPRSGSPAAPRNTALRHAKGEYVIFLDGDDSIAEGALTRLRDGIAAHPGADLYPCAIAVFDERHGVSGKVRDNYPPDCRAEMTGPEATLRSFQFVRDPCPMMQMTICRLGFLLESGLRPIDGLRCEDSEFSPRALYRARRVVPLHEPFYLYRIRPKSIMTASPDPARLMPDRARILRSNYAFFAEIFSEPGFDVRLGPPWAAKWLNWPYFFWFSPKAMRLVSRRMRRETLSLAFGGGFGDFDLLTSFSTTPRKVAAAFLKLFVRHPAAGWLADAFFRFAYNPLVVLRDRAKR